MKNMIGFSMESKRKMRDGRALSFWACTVIIFLISHFSLLTLSSCSEEDATEDEYANWQLRNEQFFATLEDSLRLDAAHWRKIKSYTLDEKTAGKATDYIYAKIIELGEETESPLFTDSVRVSYQGRLLPTTTYPEGYVFDGTVYGNYSSKTNANRKFLVSGLTVGFSTAVQHMHRNDYWRIYLPSDLGYGENGSGSVPGYSVLTFDITLIDFSHAGQTMPAWSARGVAPSGSPLGE